MTLSKRLSAIAEMAEGDTVLDVGTDHAKLPVFLVENEICKNAVAADIGEKPLQKAVQNIKKAGLFHRITTVLSDGFSNINLDGVDLIIIAGVGHDTIEEILSQGDRDAYPGKIFILQPMTGHKELRDFLSENGFCIQKETAVFENRHFYTVMKVINGKQSLNPYIGMIDVESETGQKYKNTVLASLLRKRAGLLKGENAAQKLKETEAAIRSLE